MDRQTDSSIYTFQFQKILAFLIHNFLKILQKYNNPSQSLIPTMFNSDRWWDGESVE